MDNSNLDDLEEIAGEFDKHERPKLGKGFMMSGFKD
jgi:hypothetical protein